MKVPLIIALLIWMGCTHAATPPRSAESTFSVRSFVGDGKCTASRLTQCITGRLRKGQDIYLLNSRQSAVCRSRALDSFMAGWQASDDFALTHVDTSACPGITFSIAVAAPAQPGYRLITSPESAPRELAAKIDAAVRAGFQKIVPPSTEHPTQLSSKPPEIIRVPSQAAATYIAIYENANIPGDQTHVLYANGRLRLIHPAANIRSIFMLDKRAFIHYVFDCKIGCGWRGDIVIEFSAEDFQTLLFDDSGSA